jgi:hypothetical protein
MCLKWGILRSHVDTPFLHIVRRDTFIQFTELYMALLSWLVMFCSGFLQIITTGHVSIVL